MTTSLLRSSCTALALCAAFGASAAAEFIPVGKPLPRMGLVKAGTHHYLRFMQDGETNTPLDIWTRTVSFEPKGMHIVQRWDGAAPAPRAPGTVKLLDSWFEQTTFRPLTHQRISTDKEGKRTVEGFVFAADKVTGMADLADNAQKELFVPAPESTFNFETDIEFLQALPLAAGYEAQVNFYHAGGAAPPARYTFKVTGSATLAGAAGPVDCWLVTTDYNRPGSVSTFWFAKGSQLMLRQESPLGPGKVFVKTLID
jgi:hypothetical protein